RPSVYGEPADQADSSPVPMSAAELPSTAIPQIAASRSTAASTEYRSRTRFRAPDGLLNAPCSPVVQANSPTSGSGNMNFGDCGAKLKRSSGTGRTAGQGRSALPHMEENQILTALSVRFLSDLPASRGPYRSAEIRVRTAV